MDQTSTPDYEFRGYRLDTTLQVLTSPEGEPVALPSRAFETLRYLVERAGDLVSKGDLMKSVWPRSVVAENNLSQCILALRKALGENAGDRRFILTVPGRGFKFVAPVSVVPHGVLASRLPAPPFPSPTRQQPEVATGPAITAAVRPSPATSPLRRWGWIASIGAIAVAVGLAVVLTNHGHLTSPAEYQVLTEVSDTALAPVLSPDGRMMAFIRGSGDEEGFATLGQVWLKVLPDGEPMQLTHVTDPIYAPTFTPDGTRVAFSIIKRTSQSSGWDTYTVPVTGGEPTLLLPNATGLTYIGPHQVMYSEFKVGTHLGIVTSQDDRSGQREIYFPSHMRGMAHFSYLSPDRKSVLIAEMDRSARFRQCRLAPFDGSSPGGPIGPAGSCRYAAWSADGAWMYFSAIVDGHYHLWRQRYPDGRPEQITFGPTDQVGVALSPDGHALLTSAGLLQTTISLHEHGGERALTTASSAYSPWLSDDARRLYFLTSRGPKESPELWRMDVASGVKTPILTGYDINRYDISYDEQQVVFTVGNASGSEIWIAPLDHHAGPKLLRRGADQAAFDRHGRVYFRSYGDHANYLHRMAADGSGDEQVYAAPILEIHGVAPGGDRVAVDLPAQSGVGSATLLSINGGAPWVIADTWAPAHWSRDGKWLYVETGWVEATPHSPQTAVLPTGPDGLPLKPVEQSLGETTLIPHEEEWIATGPDPSTYAFMQAAQQRNIYRIPLH